MIETQSLIPSAGDVDYTNADAICGYQLLLCKVFERAGGFEFPDTANGTIREVRQQGQLWLKEVKSLITDILSATTETQSASPVTLAAIPELLDSYDFFYRICTGGPCFDYLRQVKLKTADRWLKGDRTISDTDVVLLLLSETDRDIHTLEKRVYSYAFRVMGKWIDELSRNGRFINTRLPEAYKRLSYLLRRDLFAYLNSKDQSGIKARWIKEYTLADDQLDRLATKDLRSYIVFSNTVTCMLHPAFDGHITRHIHLYSKLASRPDLHPYYRQGIVLDLSLHLSA